MTFFIQGTVLGTFYSAVNRSIKCFNSGFKKIIIQWHNTSTMMMKTDINDE